MDATLAAVIGFVVVPAACIALERTWPSIPRRATLRPGALADAVWYVVEAYVARNVAPWAVYAALVPMMVALGMSAPEFFQGFGPAARIPFWWQVPIVLVLADFLSYWHFHAVHRSSRDVQLVATTGACWESVHSAPTRRNDATQFRDVGD
jgi:hypothetical protein